MLVDLTEVSPLTGKPTAYVSVNPAHVVSVRPVLSAQNPQAMAFSSEVALVVGGKLTVEGSLTEVRQKLNAGGLR